jgi:3,4-dihydroxy 2-butanone 4-phosphate synthase/GTP cyclohydrolase II
LEEASGLTAVAALEPRADSAERSGTKIAAPEQAYAGSHSTDDGSYHPADLAHAPGDSSDTVLATIEEIIQEACNGRMFILVDDQNRENEGDLVLPAQMVTPGAINFMATHGRGLICLALSADRCDELGLAPMSLQNKAPMETGFTVSIEARIGVDTGISANDRARTISVAINCNSAAESLVSPGHIFPLRARRGGVLVRAGHTEAAVDISRLAGLNASGVICEIMNEDGTMARMPDLITFARQHKLKIGTIRDLIAYRCRHDHVVERCGTASVTSRWGGSWTAHGFTNTLSGTTAVAMVMGEVSRSGPTLVRMHALDVIADAFGSEDRRNADLLQRSIEIISQAGAGVIVLLGHSSAEAVSALLAAHDSPAPHSDMAKLRDYGFGAQVLSELGVHEMELLTNSSQTPIALEGYGLRIVGKRPIGGAARDKAA